MRIFAGEKIVIAYNQVFDLPYTIILNGTEVLVYDDQTGKAIEKGPIGFQLHGGKVMAIDFRNIKVMEL